LRVLRKQDNPQQFEDLLNPPEEDGFLFTTVGVGAATAATAATATAAPPVNAAEEKEKREDPDYNPEENIAREEAEEEEAEEDEYEEEEEDKKAPEDKFKDFKELVKMLNGRGANEVKLNNVINYLTTSFPKDKYPQFKTLMAVKTGSHFDVGHPRVNLESFFDLYREERDTLSFASLMNLLIRIKIDSIKDVNLRDSFKEFFTSHIHNDVNGVKYRDRVELYIQGKY
jgi:actin-related protein